MKLILMIGRLVIDLETNYTFLNGTKLILDIVSIWKVYRERGSALCFLER